MLTAAAMVSSAAPVSPAKLLLLDRHCTGTAGRLSKAARLQVQPNIKSLHALPFPLPLALL
jgi:hypothetical protein